MRHETRLRLRAERMVLIRAFPHKFPEDARSEDDERNGHEDERKRGRWAFEKLNLGSDRQAEEEPETFLVEPAEYLESKGVDVAALIEGHWPSIDPEGWATELDKRAELARLAEEQRAAELAEQVAAEHERETLPIDGEPSSETQSEDAGPDTPVTHGSDDPAHDPA